MIVGEVKEGEARLNAAASDPAVTKWRWSVSGREALYRLHQRDGAHVPEGCADLWVRRS